MADKLKVEIAEKDVTVPENLKNDLTKFKGEIERKAKEIQQQKTLAEAQKLMDGAQISVDYKDLALSIGDVVLKFETRKELDDKIAEIDHDLNAKEGINAQLAAVELEMRRASQKVIDDAKNQENNLSDTVKDKVSSEIDFSKKIKEKSWLGSFLTGTTTLEQAIDDKNETELEAFRKTLLKALVKGKDEYEKVLQNGGEATFNKKEWYTLQFIEANKDLLSKKDSKIDWRAVKDAYGRGLENGEPTGGTIPVVEQQSPTKEAKENKETNSQFPGLITPENLQYRINATNGTIEYSAVSLEDFKNTFMGLSSENTNQDIQNGFNENPGVGLDGRGNISKQITRKLNRDRRDFEKRVGKPKDMKRMLEAVKANLDQKIQAYCVFQKVNVAMPWIQELRNINYHYMNEVKGYLTDPNYIPRPYTVKYQGVVIPGLKNAPSGVDGLTGDQLYNAYHGQQSEFLKKNPDFYTQKGDMKGLFQAGTDWLGNNTNMTPKQAEFWNGAFKIGSVVGLGYVGWNILKGVFGKEGTKVFGRAKKKGEGWAWLGGTVGATMLMQSMTSENPFSFAYKLFNGGLDSKNFEKIPRLKQFTDKLKVNPALNDYMKYGAGMSMLFPGTSFGDIINQGSVIDGPTDGKVKTNRASLLAYYTQKISNPNTPASEKEAFKIAMQNLNSMTDQQLNTVVAGGLDAAGIKDKTAAQQIVDYNKTWKEYMEQQEKAAKEIKNETIKSLVPPTITPETKAALKANGSKELTDEEAVKLQLALIELQKKDKNAVLIFTDKNGLILRTRNGDVPVKVGLDGKWQVAGFDKALFAEPSHALNIAAVTAFFINNFKGRVTTEETPWVLNGGDLEFGKQTWLSKNTIGIPGLNKLTSWFAGKTEALDGADILGSSMKKLGGDVFESNIGAYAEYLNGLKKNGISIWKKDGGLTTTAQIDGFIPERKKAVVEATPGSTPTTKEPTATNPDTKETPSNTQPGTTPEKKEPVVDVNDKATVLNEKTPEFTPEDIALGDQWYEKYNHKDGGDKTGKNPVERNKTFFYIWAKSFHQNTPYFTVDAYGTIGSSKGKQYGIIYERPVGGEIAPKRIKLQTGWYGHNTKVNDKPE